MRREGVRARHTVWVGTGGEGAVASPSPSSIGLREVELTLIGRFSASC